MKVFALGGADPVIESIKRTYDSLGRLEFITSYEDNNGGGTVHNQVQLAYNDMGQLATSYQSHQGVVNTGTSPKVQYSYDTTVSGTVFSRQHRLSQITHPNNRTTVYDYDPTTNPDRVNNRLSLPRWIWSGGTQLVAYDYAGAGRLAIADYLVPDVKLDYYQGGPVTTYNGLDRFARVKDQFWDGYGTTADVSRVQHGYDYASNRKWREDVIAANNGYNHDELYTYDGLHRLTDADRGNLDAAKTGLVAASKNFAHEWVLDALGNWTTFKEDTDTDATWELDQTRTHNKANEVTGIGANAGDNWYDPTAYGGSGNMDTSPKPGAPKDSDPNGRKLRFTWDAWNRPVKLEQSPTDIPNWTVVGQNEYDGLNQRIVKTASGVAYDYYYNDNWQILEVHKSGITSHPLEQFVWHPYYVAALALRVYDADINGAGAPVDHYYAHDANFNAVAVVGNTGTWNVVERYQYSAYGNLKVLDANFADDTPDGKTDIGNGLTYTGRDFDGETGLYHYRNRYYDSQLGRFVSRDPIEYEAGDENLYAYIDNSPVNSLDPLGLFRAGGWVDYFYAPIDLPLQVWENLQTSGRLDAIAQQAAQEQFIRRNAGGETDGFRNIRYTDPSNAAFNVEALIYLEAAALEAVEGNGNRNLAEKNKDENQVNGNARKMAGILAIHQRNHQNTRRVEEHIALIHYERQESWFKNLRPSRKPGGSACTYQVCSMVAKQI